MKPKIKLFRGLVASTLISLLLYAPISNSRQIANVTWLGFNLDTSQLMSRKDSFNMVNELGQKVGSMVLEGFESDSKYVWKDISILDGVVKEEVTYTFDKSLRLEKSDITFLQGSTEILGHLNWDKGHVTGDYQITQSGKSRTVAIDTTSLGLIDRAEIFAFAQTLPLAVGLKAPVKVLVQPSGEIWKMSLEVIGEEKCIVPSGEFDTFKIKLSGGSLSNILYISKDNKRKLVKVEIIGQPLVIELVTKP
jgi:hypothetical protein